MEKILIIDDEAFIRENVERILNEEGYQVLSAEGGKKALELVSEEEVDLVLLDLNLGTENGIDVLRSLKEIDPDILVIIITGFGSVESAVDSLKMGAFHYMKKPFKADALRVIVKLALQTNSLKREVRAIRRGDLALFEKVPMVGASSIQKEIIRQAKEVARFTAATVLLTGESGTGKELVAKAIHHLSDRRDAPFIEINCASIPVNLLESELFGHEKGAFTGAHERRIGRFEQADRGTIFLDEIGDMTPGTQVKLLRVLQDKILQRLGGKDNIAVDVRVIAATHRNLEAAIQDRQFREDLYYRLSVVVITLPPLRERKEDIPELARFFLRKHARELGVENPSIHADAIELLQAQNWPGNVRELENVIRKVLLQAQGYTIGGDHVRSALKTSFSPADAADLSLREYVDRLLTSAQQGELSDAHARVLTEAERQLFSRAIELAHGNQAKAARWVGVSRLTMREKLIQFGMHPGQQQEGH